jgi:membrane-associated phospholipid phosphatase
MLLAAHATVHARILPRAIRLLALLALILPAGAGGQGVRESRPATAPDTVERARAYPDLDVGRESAFLGFGAALELAIQFLETPVRPVPALGFDRAEIDWSVDRGVVGKGSRGADTASDRSRDAAALLSLVIGLATSWHDPRREVPRRALLYAETVLLTHGLTYLGKEVFGRPRPFTYVAADERPGYLVPTLSDESTFQSMPSGHASSAWAAVALGMTDHLLARPDASAWERAGIGFLGGALAGATAALRVEAGQHFPSDVVAGAALGIATGATVPLLHRGDQPLPSGQAWLQAAGGTLTGALLGALVAQRY